MAPSASRRKFLLGHVIFECQNFRFVPRVPSTLLQRANSPCYNMACSITPTTPSINSMWSQCGPRVVDRYRRIRACGGKSCRCGANHALGVLWYGALSGNQALATIDNLILRIDSQGPTALKTMTLLPRRGADVTFSMPPSNTRLPSSPVLYRGS